MKFFGWIEKLISEHGSAAALRDHLALVKEQKTQFEAQNILLTAKIKQLEEENVTLQNKTTDLQINLENATKQIKTLEDFKGKYPQAIQQIRRLEAMNQDLESQLRIKSIGF